MIRVAPHFTWKGFCYSNVRGKEAASERLLMNCLFHPLYAEDPFNSTRSFHLARAQKALHPQKAAPLR